MTTASSALRTEAAVKIAVVGHANTGKTSLIRTLLRDSKFGEVADFAGTTRHVEAAELRVQGEQLLTLFDTPGLEDSVALRALWEQTASEEDQSVSARMADFIATLDQYSDFAQEQKVLRQAYRSDVLLYVVDAREPYLGKYRDELVLLGATGRPIVPVLNFIAADPDSKAIWRERLIDHGLHAVVEYDTVAFTMQAEQRLYEKLQSLSEENYQQFARVIEHNADEYRKRCHSAARAIAEQYINVAAYRITVDADSIEQSTPAIQNLVRKAEQKSVDQTLNIFGFDRQDVRNEYLPVQNGKWELDLFDAQTYKDFGVQAGSGAAKGAAVGAGIDLVVGGVSLGVGAAIGAVAGVIWNSVRRYGGSIKNRLTGASYICVDEQTVELFYLRQRYLLNCLMARGHAAQTAVAVDKAPAVELQQAELKSLTRTIRDHHDWSYLDKPLAQHLASMDKRRTESVDALTALLLVQSANGESRIELL